MSKIVVIIVASYEEGEIKYMIWYKIETNLLEKSKRFVYYRTKI
ncbi:Uncharacterised protein [uncultured Clostridium sp.]|nr:hypothetical protein [uncultured Clostridium sp.]SCJ51019.1 Uncharacterised protein [uncultured Clostridium sp.]